MITKEEIKKIALEAGLTSSQIEKDYVLGWLLAGIAQHPELSSSWIFKGGTCLRKIYFGNYRYSEDLDFTVLDKNAIHLDKINALINEVCHWVTKKSGIEINTSRSVFEKLSNEANQNILQGKIYYRGPISPNAPRQWPRIKFDLTADEIITTPPQKMNILHSYSDAKALEAYQVNTYGIYDLFSEKIRALFERTRPRDLYDVVELYNRVDDIDLSKLKMCLQKKCTFKNIEALRIEDLKIESCKGGWDDQLAHQLDKLPSFEEYFNKFKFIHHHMSLYNLKE